MGAFNALPSFLMYIVVHLGSQYIVSLAGMSGIHLNQQDGIAQLLEHKEENPRVVPARFLSD